MKKIIYSISLILVSIVSLNGQTSWDFTNSLEGWSPFRFSETINPTSVTLTTQGQNNPRFDLSSTISNPVAINTANHRFAIVRLRVSSGGPDYMRFGYFYDNNGSQTLVNVNVPLEVGEPNFREYTIDMASSTWTGTIEELRLQFKDNDGTFSGAVHNSTGETVEFDSIEFVDNPFQGMSAIYVNPTTGSSNGDGSVSNPFKDIANAIDFAEVGGISNVYISAGTYTIPNSIEINTQATNRITLSPAPNTHVTLNLKNFRNFLFYENAKNIEIKGFEIDGQSNTVEHYQILSQYVWNSNSFYSSGLSGGGLAIQVEEAEDIFITDNVIHDFYQKAVNIEDGRYVTVSGNVIYNIALTSLSGGHGIMRQQGSGSFSDADDTTKYRWDLDGNLIFNVHQRIYSWVPSKGYMNWTLDEGKPLLIDETPSHDTNMKARIRNNVVAYFKIDGIRLKPTNNLEVVNNSLFSTDTHADGITDTSNVCNCNTYNVPFLNLKVQDNAVHVASVAAAFELNDAASAVNNSMVSGNVAAYGSVAPVGAGTTENTPLYEDPEGGNFTIIRSGVLGKGIEPAVLSDLLNRANEFGVNLEDSGWINDNKKNSQTLLDNIPGIEDGVPNNETIFTAWGTYDDSDLEFGKPRKSLYFPVNADFVAANPKPDGSPMDLSKVHYTQYDGLYEIVVAEDYTEWLDDEILNRLRDTNNDNIGDTAYGRIRYGASVIAQNKVIDDNTLTIFEIEAAEDYTQTIAENNTITLDGDAVVVFNYTPVGNEVFDLFVADNFILSNGSTTIFDDFSIEGYTGAYTLTYDDSATPQKVVLTLTENTLSISENNVEDIRLFPNPSKAGQNIEVKGDFVDVKEITLINLLGQPKNLSFNYNPNTFTINFKLDSNLTPGIYLLRVKEASRQKFIKLLIN